MSLSKIYKMTPEIATRVQLVELDQVSGLNCGGGMIPAESQAHHAAGPNRPDRPPVPPAQDRNEIEARLNRLAEVESRFHEAAQTLALALEKTADLRKSILDGSTDDMLRLVLAIAEQVVQRELQTDPETIVRIIGQALGAAIKSDMFHIKVSPEDFKLVNERKPLFLASLSGLKNISFEADPQIARGGCLVESELGRVDATLETRMTEIRQQLFNAIPVRHAGTG